MLSRRYWALAATLLASLAHAQLPPPEDPGRRLFETHCAFCHGPHGEGGKGPTLAQPTLPRASTDDALLAIIRRGIDGTEMPRARMQSEEIKLVASYVRALGRIEPEQVKGDPERGAQAFAKGACLQCHTVSGRGGAFGPDLSEIGRRRSAAYLRRAVTEPSAEVPQSFNAFRSDINMPENFLHVLATPRGGAPVAGIRVNEDTFSIQLRDLAGRVHSFKKADLARLEKQWGVSPMPAFASVFTPDELDDLIAYLVSLKGKPPAPATRPATASETTLH